MKKYYFLLLVVLLLILYPVIARGDAPVIGKYMLGIAMQDVKAADGNISVVVTGVVPGSPADIAGIKPYDIILTLDKRPVVSLEEVKQKIGSANQGQIVLSWKNSQSNETFSRLVPLELSLDQLKRDHRVEIVMEDNFDDDSGKWYLGSNKYIKDGVFVLNSDAYYGSSSSDYTVDACMGNYIIEANLRRTAGGVESGYGLQIGGASDFPDYVFFMISPAGKYQIQNYIDKTKKTKILVPWKDEPVINKSGFNLLDIVYANGRYDFYINSSPIASFADNDIKLSDKRAAIMYQSGTVEADVFRIFREKGSVQPVNSGMETIDNFFNAKPVEVKDITVTGVQVIPPDIRPSGSFDLQIASILNDSNARGEEKEFFLTYSIKKGDAVLLKKKIPFKSREGVETVSKKQGMKASNEPGDYIMEVTAEYEGVASTKSTAFRISR